LGISEKISEIGGTIQSTIYAVDTSFGISDKTKQIGDQTQQLFQNIGQTATTKAQTIGSDIDKFVQTNETLNKGVTGFRNLGSMLWSKTEEIGKSINNVITQTTQQVNENINNQQPPPNQNVDANVNVDENVEVKVDVDITGYTEGDPLIQENKQN